MQQQFIVPTAHDDPPYLNDDFFSQALNASQLKAATTTEGPVLVIAGAGSGKTRTLIYRVAYLVSRQVPRDNILLLTFTRRAAQEMLGRAAELLCQSCHGITGGTFHAVANILLRRYAALLGYPSSFTIIDRADAEGIVNLLKSSLDLSGAGKRFPSKRVLVNAISAAINRNQPLQKILDEQFSHIIEFSAEIHRLELLYQQFKRQHALMDYDDLLVNFRVLLEDNPTAQRDLSSRFRYLMVDEYQDTNSIQAEIVRLLSAEHGNVMAVGDDAQSIYSFRGADFRNIMEFPKTFAHTRIITLEENYRSTQPILQLSNEIIARAQERYTKNLFTRIPLGAVPVLFSLADEYEEARHVARHIARLKDEGTRLDEIAVLFRSGFHSYKLELELGNLGIPFLKRGGLKLTESSHIKDVLSYFRVLVNPQDSLSWNRILLLLEKLGPRTAQQMLREIATHPDPFQGLASFPASRAWKVGFDALLATMKRLRAPGMTPINCYELLLEYYLPVLQRVYYDDYPKRAADLDQLTTILAGYENLEAFLDDTALDPPEMKGSHDAVEGTLVLSTIHSAKGLEWETVFILGLAEGRFPANRVFEGPEWEEERRLLYVAATRAKRWLFLAWPRRLSVQGRGLEATGLSPFLSEIPRGSVEIQHGRDGFSSHAPIRPRPAAVPTRAVPAPQSSGPHPYRVGDIVMHPFFGRGTVKKTTGPRSVQILFDRHGRKDINLDFARLAPAP